MKNVLVLEVIKALTNDQLITEMNAVCNTDIGYTCLKKAFEILLAWLAEIITYLSLFWIYG